MWWIEVIEDNEIYLQLVCFSNGTKEYWEIESSKDAKNFLNLKKVALSSAKEHIVEELNKMGIEIIRI